MHNWNYFGIKSYWIFMNIRTTLNSTWKFFSPLFYALQPREFISDNKQNRSDTYVYLHLVQPFLLPLLPLNLLTGPKTPNAINFKEHILYETFARLSIKKRS